MSMLVCKEDLINLGYRDHTARSLIAEAKAIMVQSGYPFYNNKRLGQVPIHVVEEIVGVKLYIDRNGDMKDDN